MGGWEGERLTLRVVESLRSPRGEEAEAEEGAKREGWEREGIEPVLLCRNRWVGGWVGGWLSRLGERRRRWKKERRGRGGRGKAWSRCCCVGIGGWVGG